MDEDQQRAIETGCGCRCSWCGLLDGHGKTHCGRSYVGCFKDRLSPAQFKESNGTKGQYL